MKKLLPGALLSFANRYLSKWNLTHINKFIFMDMNLTWQKPFQISMPHVLSITNHFQRYVLSACKSYLH